MTTLEVGKRLVELCKQGKNQDAIKELYSADIVSVEAQSMPNMPAEVRGLEAVNGKGQWWYDNHTIHSATAEGPFPHGDRFIVRFQFDVTHKPSEKRFVMDEMALYTVRNDKIVREEYFYVGG